MYVPHERRALILRLLEQRGYLRTAALAEELGVTEETIRTDIIALQQRKLLHRVHGGARYMPPAGGAEDGARLDCQLIELLLAHLRPGMRLYLDGGALAHTLLAQLGSIPCRIITASLRVAQAAAAPALPQQVSLPGGTLDKASQFIHCEPAEMEQFLAQAQPDLAILFPTALPAPGRPAYRHRTRAEWASAAAHAAKGGAIVVAAAHTLYTEAPHCAPCTPALLITEDNLPPGFESQPAELLPYLSPADIRQEADPIS